MMPSSQNDGAGWGEDGRTTARGSQRQRSGRPQVVTNGAKEPTTAYRQQELLLPYDGPGLVVGASRSSTPRVGNLGESGAAQVLRRREVTKFNRPETPAKTAGNMSRLR